MITVFTPTYNRSFLLSRLYESLRRQTYQDFEWLIVDDQSEDDTSIRIADWIREGDLLIRYYQVSHGGKHRAINHAVKRANGDLFFIVDSDDYLLDDGLEQIAARYDEIKENPMFAGVAGCCMYPDGRIIVNDKSFGRLDTDSVTFQYKMGFRGDMAEAIKLSILQHYPFPEFDDEYFMTEDVMWNEIAKHYMLRYFNRSIYVSEYRAEGLTQNIAKHFRNSPKGTMLYYVSLMQDPRMGFRRRMISAINYWRYTIAYKERRDKLPYWSYCLYPLGMLIYWLDLSRKH